MNKIQHITFAVFTLTSSAFAGGSGAHDHADMHWNAPDNAKAWVNPIRQNKRSANKGEIIFQKNCISCHGTNADGNGPLASALTPKPTNLRIMAGMHEDGDFAWKIYNGRGAMPAWKDTLTEAQIWHLVNYIQLLASTKTPASDGHGNGHGH